MYDISILVPAIRTIRWKSLYDSIVLACKKYKWELVLVTPFDLPEELREYDNINIVKENGQVSRAVQRGMLELKSDLVFLTVDDCVLMEDSLDISIDDYKQKCGYNDVLCMRYSEGGNIQDEVYYIAHTHPPYRIPGIDSSWKIAPQFIMNKNKYIDMGGFDCQFEYINEPVHDFMFRLQNFGGGSIHISSTYCCVATWYSGETGDHSPIFNAQTYHDWPIFLEMYKKPNSRYIIDYDNWKNTPEIWERRFSQGVPNNYTELVAQEGYKI